jgi:hypothetical protein
VLRPKVQMSRPIGPINEPSLTTRSVVCHFEYNQSVQGEAQEEESEA